MSLSPTVIWLLVGGSLCLTEFIFPTAFVAFVMGVSALLTAVVAEMIPLNLQVALWAILSLVMVVLSRRLVQTRAAKKLDATEAETITEILPGKTGRVRYEGNSWTAQCEDPTIAIAPHQKVYVTARQGNILIVLPEDLLHS